jgi:hypothetical protein
VRANALVVDSPVPLQPANVLRVLPISPQFQNKVTLRGNVGWFRPAWSSYCHRKPSVSRECRLHVPFDIYVRIVRYVEHDLFDRPTSEVRI